MTIRHHILLTLLSASAILTPAIVRAQICCARVIAEARYTVMGLEDFGTDARAATEAESAAASRLVGDCSQGEYRKALASVAALADAPAAPVSTLDFDGDIYKRAYESRQQAEPFTEFTRPGETVETWTRLLTLRWYKGSALRPLEAARRLAQRAEASYAGANAFVSEDSTTSEAVVHFLAMAAGSSVVEVDAFKYGPAGDGGGLVAVQFAFRFTIGKTDPAKVKMARRRAVEAIRRFDLARARANFRSP